MADLKLNACADQLVYLPTLDNMHTQHVHIHYMQWFWEIVHTYRSRHFVAVCHRKVSMSISVQTFGLDIIGKACNICRD